MRRLPLNASDVVIHYLLLAWQSICQIKSADVLGDAFFIVYKRQLTLSDKLIARPIASSVSQHPMHSEVTKPEKETFGERSGFIVPRQ
jgi:hypothetical protein